MITKHILQFVVDSTRHIMVHCCVPNCTSDTAKKSENVTFHHFPTEPSLRDKWKVSISRQGTKIGSLWSPNKTSRVCSLHFIETDFSISTKNKRILPNKIPSLFTNYPVHKQKNSQRRSSPVSRYPLPVPIKRRRTDIPVLNENNDLKKNIGIQVSIPTKSCKLVKKSSRKINYRLRQTISKLKAKVKKYKEKKEEKMSELHRKVDEIENNAKNGDFKSIFLLEQIKYFGNKNVNYDETTLKICVLWHRKAPNGYNFIRSMNYLKLPHKKTLKNYIGYTSGDTGTTSLIKRRLQFEANNVSHPEEKLGSLIIDEMAIQGRIAYDRNLDKFLGYSEEQIEEMGYSDKIANRLLCFLFRGLSTAVRIPVAFYFTRQLTGQQLHSLTKKVVMEVEETGFHIVRIVTDNASVNVNMMKEFCKGTLMSQIPHPTDESRPLFLSFDSSHILKNLRTQFLEKDFIQRGTIISSSHLKKLYDLQRNSVVTPVRGLTRKVVFPSNLEKMNVKRAKYVFSTSVTAALKSLPIFAPEIVANEESLQATVQFLDIIRKWHDIHDVCNIKHAYMSRNPDKRIFVETDDERLSWLIETFIPYINEIQSTGHKENKISQGTYEALVLTTESTVKCVRYLLSIGFHYVLSRNLSSDDIELLFSHLRRKGGFNDSMDARSCIYAMETTLITGLVKSSSSGNVQGSNFSTMQSLNPKDKGPMVEDVILNNYSLPSHIMNLLDKPLEETPATMEMISLAMIGGYLVKIAEENSQCESCLEQLSSVVSDGPLMCLIKKQDRGGLCYPSRKFVLFLKNVLKFTLAAVPIVGNKNVLKTLKHFILPKFSDVFSCRDCEKKELGNIILTKFLKPILQNQACKLTNDNDFSKNFKRKPISRKVLKL